MWGTVFATIQLSCYFVLERFAEVLSDHNYFFSFFGSPRCSQAITMQAITVQATSAWAITTWAMTM